ncbi:hypothetical protein [Acidovorax sp. A1169]|uniref:hypothetical protein n=1 Tax=Acidovorax sp. A1169 TaxID=3059524 RepID=UPI002737B14E|nr:hypothetical protein [Acidovorax sp. A1169]MDP4075850.1 hypothetical protein [Acidovorax sp. A1169]
MPITSGLAGPIAWALRRDACQDGGLQNTPDCFQNWNSQFATGWFFFDHLRRTVQPIDEPNPQGDSPNPVRNGFCSGFLSHFFLPRISS